MASVHSAQQQVDAAAFAAAAQVGGKPAGRGDAGENFGQRPRAAGRALHQDADIEQPSAPAGQRQPLLNDVRPSQGQFVDDLGEARNSGRSVDEQRLAGLVGGNVSVGRAMHPDNP